jgi:hypothetical protein
MIMSSYNLQTSNIRNLGDKSDEFGSKSMCIFEYLVTFQHGIYSLIDLKSL